MRLYELAYACRLYGVSTESDAAIDAFLRATHPGFNLHNPPHRKALLVWLNSWGCRQFEKSDHPLASRSLKEWGRSYLHRLPDQDAILARLPDTALGVAAEAYGDLMGRPASMRKGRSGQYSVTVGPTGAAKVLFAVRPSVFPPWDHPIRKYFRYDGSATSYRQFLVRVRDEIRALCEEAGRLGLKAGQIPRLVGRPSSSLPKLVDEFYWVTITGRYKVPAPEDLENWLRWARAGTPPHPDAK